MSFLRSLVGLDGVLHGLPGMLVPRLVIFLLVMRCGDPMRVRGHLVEFRSSLMRIFRHNSSL